VHFNLPFPSLAQKLRHRKKSSWRAVVVKEMKAEVICPEVNKSRLTDRFNKIPGGREREAIYNRF